MSYINDALKKAQEEKDYCYGKLDYYASTPSARAGFAWQKRGAIVAAIVVIGVAAAFFSAKFFFSPVAGVQKSPEALAEKGKAPAGATEQANVPKKETFPAAPVVDDGALKKEAAKTSAAVTVKTADARHVAGKHAAAKHAAEKQTESKKAEAKQAEAKQVEAKKAAGEKKAAIKLRYDEAIKAGRKGDFARAEKLYTEVLALDPDNVKALNNLGVVYLAEKKGERAMALFRRAVVLKRNYVDPYYNMACLYAQKNDIDQSLWYLKIAISIDKDVRNWVRKDVDMKNVVTSPKFKEIDGGAKN
jgi:Flp pilus assembly protein TadD